MRVIAVAIFASLLGSAFAQITPEEQTIQSLFTALRGERQIMLELDGTDSFGPRTNTLYSYASFAWDPFYPEVTAKAEINDYVNNGQTHRITADGTTLWSFDFGHNSYTSFRYGSYSGAQPAGFRASMFDELTTSSKGPTIFLTRMLREIYSGDVAQYRTWLPLANITVVSSMSTTVSMKDPVVPGRQYDGDDTNFYIVYTYKPNDKLKRSAAFHFTRPTTTERWNLREIYYGDWMSINASTPRLVDWRITVHTGVLPRTPSYIFVPPSNSRPISNVKGQGG